MLKGHSKVILTDVHTGKQEIVEQDNIVTNAVEQLLKSCGALHSQFYYGTNSLNTCDYFLGGIMLLDKRITEDADNIVLPPDVNVTGAARVNTQYSSKLLELGSYNATESVINDDEKYRTFVYDFNTSQANGTIASIALTNYCHTDYMNYGSKCTDTSLEQSSSVPFPFNAPRREIIYSSDADSHYFNNAPSVRYTGSGDVSMNYGWGTTSVFPILDDFDGGYIYYLIKKDASTVILRKVYDETQHLSLVKSSVKIETIVSDIEITIPVTNWYLTRVGYDSGNVILLINNYNGWNANTTIGVYKLNVATGALSKTTDLLNQRSYNYTLDRRTYAYYDGNLFHFATPRQVGLINPPEYYNIATGVMDYVEIPELIRALGWTTVYSGAVAYKTEPYRVMTDIRTVNTTYYPCCVNMATKKMYITRSLVTEGGYLDGLDRNSPLSIRDDKLNTILADSGASGLDVFGSYRQRLVRLFNPEYLGTINNLSTPVVKTSDRTMKVIYTLREV